MGQFKILRRIRGGGYGVPEFLNNRGEEWVFETREAAQREVDRLNRGRFCDFVESNQLIASEPVTPFSYHVAEVIIEA
jgi:hypothetical protein